MNATLTRYVQQLIKVGLPDETVRDMAALQTIGQAANRTAAEIARDRTMVEKLRQCPSEDRVASLRDEEAKARTHLDKCSVKAREAADALTAATARHNAVAAELRDAEARRSAREGIVKSDHLRAVDAALSAATPSK